LELDADDSVFSGLAEPDTPKLSCTVLLPGSNDEPSASCENAIDDNALWLVLFVAPLASAYPDSVPASDESRAAPFDVTGESNCTCCGVAPFALTAAGKVAADGNI
jgi:hypothetical protein